MRAVLVLNVTFAISLFLGCTGSPTSESASTDNSDDSAANTPAAGVDDGFVAIVPQKVYTDPTESVNDFLVAVTKGDDKTATSLLSYAAQRETWSNGLALTSDGFPGTRFKITDVESVSDIESHVQTTWEDENKNTYPCVWLLRKEQHGWCIFAMATKFMDGAQPVILPFEDHDELKRRQHAALQQLKQHQLAAQQASRIPTTSPPEQQGGQVQQASRTTEIR